MSCPGIAVTPELYPAFGILNRAVVVRIDFQLAHGGRRVVVVDDLDEDRRIVNLDSGIGNVFQRHEDLFETLLFLVVEDFDLIGARAANEMQRRVLHGKVAAGLRPTKIDNNGNGQLLSERRYLGLKCYFHRPLAHIDGFATS